MLRRRRPSCPQTLIPGYENTAIWTLSNLQLLALAHVFAVSRPFRAPQWSNTPFTLVWLALIGFSAYLVLGPEPWAVRVFELLPFPDPEFNWACAGMCAGSYAASSAFEAAVASLREWRKSGGRFRRARSAVSLRCDALFPAAPREALTPLRGARDDAQPPKR